MTRAQLVAVACLCSMACGGGGGSDDGGAEDGASDAVLDADSDASVDSCAALMRIVHTADPGNGPERLGDGDTDENGIADRDEWGPLLESPLDRDLDGLDDYLDLDDDGDGLLDIYDDQRLVAAVESDWLADDNRLFVISAAVDVDDRAPETARPGDTLRVTGEGFDCTSIVTFAGTPTIHLAPVSATPTEIVVVVPEGARGPLVVFRGDEHSNALPLHIADTTEPLLELVEEPGRAGESLVLRGSGLAGVTEVTLHGTAITPESTSADEVRVAIPIDLPGPPDVFVSSGEAESNRVAMPVVRSVRATATLADTTNVELLTATSREAVDASGNADVDVRMQSGMSLVSAIRGGGTLVEALVLPSDSSVELSTASSATATGLMLTHAWRLVELDSLDTLRNRVDSLSEAADLAAAIETQLAAGDVRDFSMLGAELVALTNATQALIDEGIDDGSLIPIGGVELEIVIARIDPSESSGVSVSQIPDTDNVRVENDTALFLSGAIRDQETRQIRVPHVSGPFSPRVVAPQSALLGLASELDYDAPRGRDAIVEVVTSGAGAPLPMTPTEERVHTMLALRTVITNVITPTLEVIFELEVSADTWVRSFIRHAPAELLEFGRLVRAGEIEAAAIQLLELVRVQSAGVAAAIRANMARAPDVRRRYALFFDAVGKKLKAAALDRLIDKVADYIPVVEKIKAVYELLGAVGTQSQLASTVEDMAGTPARIDFEVSFGLALSDLEPDELPRGCTGEVLRITGAGLHPDVDGPTLLPEITVTDNHPLGSGAITIGEGHRHIAADGTRVDVDLPELFTTTMQGPLTVMVTHRGETASSADSVAVSGDPQLIGISPPAAAEGEMITVNGSGLDAPIELVFADVADPSVRVTVSSFTSMSDTQLQLMVPTLPSSSRNWLVQARQGSGLCQVSSNSVGFSTSAGECFTVVTNNGGISGINASGIIAGTTPLGPFLLEPREGAYYIDDDGDDENDLLNVMSIADKVCGTHYGISDTGSIVGSCSNPVGGGMRQSFIADAGGIRLLGAPGDFTEINAISPTGVMVGRGLFMAMSGNVNIAASITEGSGPTSFDTPVDGANSDARRVTDLGVALGTELFMGFNRATTWPDVSVPGAVTLGAGNAVGQIVGTTATGPVVWEGGVVTPLDGPGTPLDINNLGQIVGNFGAEPILWLPEPAYGLPAGRHLLATIAFGSSSFMLAGSPAFNISINDAGQIVGGGPGWLIDLAACAP